MSNKKTIIKLNRTTIKAGVSGIFVTDNFTGKDFFLTDTELQSMVEARFGNKTSAQWIRSQFTLRARTNHISH